MAAAQFGTGITDDEEQIFDVQRPVIITAIEDVAVRGDLLDRAIVVMLPSISESSRTMLPLDRTSSRSSCTVTAYSMAAA